MSNIGNFDRSLIEPETTENVFLTLILIVETRLIDVLSDMSLLSREQRLALDALLSLLFCLYKLLERIVLTRITLYIDPHIPVQQAGFRPQRGTTEQVLALTTHIESGYERKLKTGAVLIDLSAAYDTVWTGGLMLKLAKLIPCRKILKILSVMTGTRQFHVVIGGEKVK